MWLSRGRAVLSCCVLSAFATNPKKPAVVAAGKVFGLLGFLIFFLVTHRCHGAPIGFPGKKTQHRALCAQEIGD
ncbi:hypothetical protein DA097_15975 [Vibrio rotiferianus]|nr:hypothetical protein DA097_15975 [Vibrio rotiferianus]